ncbi:MAG: protein tyrosine phosphatase [Armatimonadetes bacterium]|nr:protein tyrosine phosphatase [Armatimonadota bacterium]
MQTSDTLKILFVCSRNRRRSLTAEHVLRGQNGLQVRSAGTQPQARVVLTAGLIGWADLIFFMEKSHLNRARLRFGAELQGKEIITLHIPDDYEYGQTELIEELRARTGDAIEWPDAEF